MKVKYHKTIKVIENNGTEHNLNTQLYQVGIYGIWDNDPASQGSYEPQGLRKLEKKLKKDKESGKIKDLVLGEEICVSNDNGFWEKI